MLSYDDFDFHVSDAVEHAQPEDNAFTHIGFFVAWLFRHDLANLSLFGEAIPQQIRSGLLRPNELRDVVDGVLVADLMTPEGTAFASFYYQRYLGEYEAEFSDLPTYGVTDDPENEARAERIIDRAYADWVGAGRPKPEAPILHDLPEPADLSQLGFDSAHLAKMPDPAEIAKMFGWVDVGSLPSPHVDPVLEDLVARAVGVPLNISSTPASKWGQASTNRVLRSLGVSTRRAIILSGFGDEGSPVVSVVAVPGISGPRLTEVFGPSQERAPGYRYRTEIIGGEAARLEHGTLPSASHPGTDDPWLGGWLTVDGYLVSFSGRMLSEESVKTTIIRLRDALRNQAPRQATP